MVADPDPGKSEGGDSREVRRVGGGGGELPILLTFTYYKKITLRGGGGC